MCLNEYQLILLLAGAFTGFSHSVLGVIHNMNYVSFHTVQVCDTDTHKPLLPVYMSIHVSSTMISLLFNLSHWAHTINSNFKNQKWPGFYITLLLLMLTCYFPSNTNTFALRDPCHWWWSAVPLKQFTLSGTSLLCISFWVSDLH